MTRCSKNYQYVIINILSIVIITCGSCFIQNSIVQANAVQTVSVALMDNNSRPIAHIRLTAWRVNGVKPQAEGDTGANGVMLLKLPSGQYYFTGDISALKTRANFTAGLKGDSTTLYFISKPFVVDGTSNIALTVDSANCINIADIAGLKGYELHISQKNLGIETDVRLHAGNSRLRLYLPTRMQYTIQQTNGILNIQWPVYAAPGSQFIISINN